MDIWYALVDFGLLKVVGVVLLIAIVVIGLKNSGKKSGKGSDDSETKK